ncbi:MAG: DUF2272 domain-containing protein [Acidobacteriota bacterium]|nr:DUF2272 domain-containing protein [Acidobacteriota bacterium]
MAEPTPFARKIAAVAQEQHDKFRFVNEADPALCSQIERWTRDIGLAFVSCTSVPWAAVFVSWCVKRAGATKSEFEFAAAASVFAHRAIQNALSGAGGFHGFDVATHAAHVGDILLHNRAGNKFDFAFARTHRTYQAHAVIVVEVGQDEGGPFALVIGGNEGDAIRRTVVRLGPDGFVEQREGNPFICILHPTK